MLSVNRWVRDNWWVRQLSLFDRATTTAMRDRTKSRNYSPERDEFRREHERRRYWGLQRRHAEKLRQIHGGPTPPTTVPDQPRPTPPPPAVPAAAAVSTPPPVNPDRSAPAPRPARPGVNAPPVAAAPVAPQSAAKKRIQPPCDRRRYSTPPVPRRQQFNGESHSGHETYATPLNRTQFRSPAKGSCATDERLIICSWIPPLTQPPKPSSSPSSPMTWRAASPARSRPAPPPWPNSTTALRGLTARRLWRLWEGVP